jgi:cholesterol transport system auxiliary component
MLVAAFERTAAFHAVALTPSTAAADLRLDTVLVRLEHDFSSQPSRVRFTLRAYLIDDKTRRVVATREFDSTAPSASEDPYGGVVAANGAVLQALDELAAYCAQAARTTIFTQPPR